MKAERRNLTPVTRDAMISVECAEFAQQYPGLCECRVWWKVEPAKLSRIVDASGSEIERE